MQNHPDFPNNPTQGRANNQPRLVTSIADLDLNAELAILYSNANELFNTVANDFETPANQKAQTLSTILAILKEVLREKEVLYSITEVVEIEVALGKTLQQFPEIADEFLRVYKGNLKL